jgi:hypothetical protein
LFYQALQKQEDLVAVIVQLFTVLCQDLIPVAAKPTVPDISRHQAVFQEHRLLLSIADLNLHGPAAFGLTLLPLEQERFLVICSILLAVIITDQMVITVRTDFPFWEF